MGNFFFAGQHPVKHAAHAGADLHAHVPHRPVHLPHPIGKAPEYVAQLKRRGLPFHDIGFRSSGPFLMRFDFLFFCGAVPVFNAGPFEHGLSVLLHPVRSIVLRSPVQQVLRHVMAEQLVNSGRCIGSLEQADDGLAVFPVDRAFGGLKHLIDLNLRVIEHDIVSFAR